MSAHKIERKNCLARLDATGMTEPKISFSLALVRAVGRGPPGSICTLHVCGQADGTQRICRSSRRPGCRRFGARRGMLGRLLHTEELRFRCIRAGGRSFSLLRRGDEFSRQRRGSSGNREDDTRGHETQDEEAEEQKFAHGVKKKGIVIYAYWKLGTDRYSETELNWCKLSSPPPVRRGKKGW